MQVDIKTEALLPCQCGARPTEYSIGYGRTPYYVNCPGCGKYAGGIGGDTEAMMRWWNKRLRHAKHNVYLDVQGGAMDRTGAES